MTDSFPFFRTFLKFSPSAGAHPLMRPQQRGDWRPTLDSPLPSPLGKGDRRRRRWWMRFPRGEVAERSEAGRGRLAPNSSSCRPRPAAFGGHPPPRQGEGKGPTGTGTVGYILANFSGAAVSV